MERLRRRELEGHALEETQGTKMLSAIAAFFRALFARKDDDFKALLMSDLGIER